MNSELCIVAVDVGNSAVKFAVQQDEIIVDHFTGIQTDHWEQSAVEWAREQLHGQRLWRIASVHGSAAAQLVSAIEQLDSESNVHLITRHDVPMRVDVDYPDRLGIDRLLSAFAVSRRVDAPAVVIDAGSAVTVDWIDARGRFCGGAILPGLGLQSAALATGTDALPRVDWNTQAVIRLPAKNTSDAILSGILTGIAASIDALIERYREIAGLPEAATSVVMTGGDGPAISPHLRHTHKLIPNLVCRGLFDLPRSIAGSANTGGEAG